MELTIGVDVGGTKIAAGVVDQDGRIHEQLRVSTPGSTAEAVEAGIIEAVTKLSEWHAIAAVGVAAPGLVDEGRGLVRFTPNLPMRNRPLRQILSHALGQPVVVENDANAAAWGEHRFGGGRGVDDMVLITVGTGLGSGIVLEGRLFRGAWGGAAEVGHMRLVPDGTRCGCGNRGCWEQYASGSALVREACSLAASEPEITARMLELAAGDATAITGTMVSRAAQEGDPAALRLVADLGRWLGQGISNLACVLDPVRIVVGGGVSQLGDLLLGPAREAFENNLSAAAHRPRLRITTAELGNDAGLIGVADLARDR